MYNYLTPDHPDAFVDFPALEALPEGKAWCAKCKGHGGYNLELNAYPNVLETMENTPENRHKYVHFRAGCDNCYGSGHVELEDAEHVHDWKRISLGSCLHRETCRTCGKTGIIDSSG